MVVKEKKRRGMLFTVHTTIELGFFSAGPRTKIWSDHKLMFERTPHAHDFFFECNHMHMMIR